MPTETREHRSQVMSRVRSKNTGPEMRVRSVMHRAGYRFRLHVDKLQGKPDIVLPRHRMAMFVNGCFWHRHPDCRRATTPKTNMDYWQRKFSGNVARDESARQALEEDGWEVLVIWECQTENKEMLATLLNSVLPPRH